MARLISNSQISRSLTRSKFSPPLVLTLRHRSNSNRSGGGDGEGEAPQPQLIEIDLDSSSGSGIRKLEEAIHSVMVRRSAPDWLPFLPGYSYWVPPYLKIGHCDADLDPRRIVEVVGKIASVKTQFDTTSVSRLRGWPSNTFFTGGGGGSASAFPIPVQVVELEVKLEENSDYDSKSEDEEG